MKQWIATWMLCVGTMSATALPPGEWHIDVTGERYTLVANQAPLPALLEELSAHSTVPIRWTDVDQRHVTGAFHRLALPDLLDSLAVNYTLHYQPADTDAQPPQLLGARVGAAILPGLSDTESRTIAEWIAHLHHDEVSFNAIRATSRLRALGGAAVPALERALHQGDYQAQQLAANVLAYMDDEHYSPSDRFLQVLVEGMRDDIFPHGIHPDGRQACVFVFNARTAYHYLAARPNAMDRAEPLLARALHRGDAQQAFLAAVLLASHGRTTHLPRLADRLIPHLADNRRASDGILAAYALHKLGPAIRPYLMRALPQADQQQTDLTDLILYFLDHPNATSVPPGLKTYDNVTNNPIRHRPNLQFWSWSD